MRLLMVSGDRQVALGERGPFYSMQREFSRFFERVDVICPRPPGEVSVRTIHENVHMHPATVPRWRMVRYVAERGAELLGSHGHRLIISHDYGMFYNGMGSAHLSRTFGVPYVSELHHVPGVPVAANLRERFDQLVARTYVRWARSKAAAFRVVNQEEMPRLLLKWGVPPQKILYLPSIYLDLDVFRPPPEDSRPSFDQDLIFVGRMVTNKGIGRIVDAMAILARQGMRLRGLFVGKGPLRPAIEERARSRQLDLAFVDWIDSPEQLAEHYRRSRVCVCGSTCEGGPRFTVEAMACGTPVVSTPVGVMGQLLADGRCGELAGWDPHAMAVALRRVLEDEDLRVQMGRNAVERAQPFEYGRAIATYANGLRQLVGEEELRA